MSMMRLLLADLTVDMLAKLPRDILLVVVGKLTPLQVLSHGTE